MDVNSTINAVKQFCVSSSGSDQIWSGNKSTYHWNIGKVTQEGIMNGVVRKLAGIDVSGQQIWAVAGSFKIAPDGTILRFTGLPKKIQAKLVTAPAINPTAWERVTV